MLPLALALAALLALDVAPVLAHGVSAADRAFMEQGGLMAFLYLGAKHMVTGYDHLLFLDGASRLTACRRARRPADPAA